MTSQPESKKGTDWFLMFMLVLVLPVSVNVVVIGFTGLAPLALIIQGCAAGIGYVLYLPLLRMRAERLARATR